MSRPEFGKWEYARSRTEGRFQRRVAYRREGQAPLSGTHDKLVQQIGGKLQLLSFSEEIHTSGKPKISRVIDIEFHEGKVLRQYLQIKGGTEVNKPYTVTFTSGSNDPEAEIVSDSIIDNGRLSTNHRMNTGTLSGVVFEPHANDNQPHDSYVFLPKATLQGYVVRDKEEIPLAGIEYGRDFVSGKYQFTFVPLHGSQRLKLYITDIRNQTTDARYVFRRVPAKEILKNAQTPDRNMWVMGVINPTRPMSEGYLRSMNRLLGVFGLPNLP